MDLLESWDVIDGRSQIEQKRMSVIRDGELVQEFMDEIEVRAAHNVLEACAQTDTMEKVIFTSSVTAVIWGEDHKSTTADKELSERNWSDVKPGNP
ncbi:cinnamoyl-CoA reductase-like SNL6 [Papaver somniferum]|nr:cinnamoyl-CoA reductase-like SNL6 [Papaver somniferum]XP_026422044.1 cinnamoyl-CoA reductase-like SNL6 [Papaver somniferum]